MSSSDLALRITELSKSYTISHRGVQHITLAEQALSRLRHPFHRSEQETFWALKDINLEVKKGEVLGIIGRNGAGKSTLLKILSRITAPTTGRVELYGRLGSLLEVGTGFHPELTGRENIYLNGTILGMKRGEIDRRFDEIVEFAGVQKFLDTPVKRYSSGMYVRLAFAVAAHLDTEILVIDEVLAVGDQEFQSRCLGKLDSIAGEGRTVILVSHNLGTVSSLCQRATLLIGGSVGFDGSPSEAVSLYLSSRGDATSSYVNLQHAARHDCPQLGAVRFESVRFDDARPFVASVERGFRIELTVVHHGSTNKERFAPVLVLHDFKLEPMAAIVGADVTSDGALRTSVAFSVENLPVRPGRYGVTLVATSPDPLRGYADYDVIPEAFQLDVVSEEGTESTVMPRSWGNVRLAATTERLEDSVVSKY